MDFPFPGTYDRQRFTQYNPADCANWYLVGDPLGKKQVAMYPTMGRRHINFLGVNRLIFPGEPRGIYKSNKFVYVISENSIYRVDSLYNVNQISGAQVTTFSGFVDFDFLVVSQLPQQPSITFVGFADGEHIYIYREETDQFFTITDPNAPDNPTYLRTFGNRMVAAAGNTSQFNLSEINLLGGVGGTFDPALAWTVAAKAVFAQEVNIIKGFAVLHNLLYIFTPYKTGIWANSPSNLVSIGGTITTFPWKKNIGYDWDFGLFDVESLDVGFDRMTFMGQNREGLVQVLSSRGDVPKPISTTAISVLFQEHNSNDEESPFITKRKNGFMYSYEDAIFYRLSAGDYDPTGLIELEDIGNAIEYNFNTDTWERVVEKNGQRNRIQKHVFFNNIHLVSVWGENTVYQMSGRFYSNEVRNPNQENPQAIDAYLAEPFRYEFITKNIIENDYAEFYTEYVEMDFVWGDMTFIKSSNPFPNAEFLIAENVDPNAPPQFIIAEELGPDGGIVYILGEQGNFPVADSLTYFNWFKPHIELYWSDDGGVSFYPADVLQFSDLGVYRWRMRWYQLGPSRNRVYKLICYATSPIVVLGGLMVTRRVSGGAN